MTDTKSRWTYPTAKVTVGENSQHVRMLTAGERRAFAATSREIKDGKASPSDLPFIVASFGCVNPTVTQAEAEDFPPDLLDACVEKIMELTGFEDADEKKAVAPAATLNQPSS